jgi:hypothetical protein
LHDQGELIESFEGIGKIFGSGDRRKFCEMVKVESEARFSIKSHCRLRLLNWPDTDFISFLPGLPKDRGHRPAFFCGKGILPGLP